MVPYERRISTDADNGPHRWYVLWCCGSIFLEVFNTIQIGLGHTVTVGLRSYQMPVSFNPSRIWFGHKVPDPWMIWSNVTIMGWKTFLEYSRVLILLFTRFFGYRNMFSFEWHDVVKKSIRNYVNFGKIYKNRMSIIIIDLFFNSFHNNVV